jgi:two-component system cell cycle response regulator
MGLLTLPKGRVRHRLARVSVLGPRLMIGVALCMLALQWAHAVSGFGGAGAADFFGRWMYDAIVIVCGLASLVCGFRRPVRGTWLLLGAGLLAKAVGDVIYSQAGNLNAVPVPSVSDPFWLAVYPCAYAALLLLVRDRVRTALVATRLDGVICGAAVAAVLACVTLPTAFSSTAGTPFWTTATNLAYPLGDLILIGAIVSAIALSGWRLDRTLGTLAAAFAAWVAADVMYMFAVGPRWGAIADALVLTGTAGLALAATLDRSVRPNPDARDRGLFVPVGFGAVGLAILIGGAALGFNIVGLSLAALALGLVLVRMVAALAENRALLDESRVQASTDPLTGLGNRRKLKHDLAGILDRVAEERSFALVILDLNGFKGYNDSFGHAAGDMLLARLGSSLKAAVRGRGEAFRLGGDEFCVLAPCGEEDVDSLSAVCHRALATRGEGFSITAAHGAALVPTEAQDASQALALADARMYGNKATTGRPRAASDLADVLTAVLEERAPAVADHCKTVCDLAVATGTTLGLGEEELQALSHAASVHDLGKMAIPESILEKRGPLSPGEWKLVRQHTIIGERILNAAPAMHRAAQLVRSSHERHDGEGYPDRLRGDEIPLASRIIAVADAYAAMTTPRPHRPTASSADALAELWRCAGSQFDPQVIAAFEQTFDRRRELTPATA